ncbi:dethiobiotin synthase [Kushneria avicenniae]|uniref:ATP-dependent dethiobiotin synthetase BioD n=1 Tax=Kushneria avicenniae TaxID=402385 RepID=A0A1I1MYT6_9GAMM|nr:dethiobiotin synthase [Kushneria avicenniae]SFC88408.1 dethiobiotin synthase [Kushneria avicenniae]
MTPNAFFVTGTDTDAGKTLIASSLLHLARRRGLTTAAGKPVASGSVLTPDGLRNDDALALQAQCAPALSYDTVNPLAFEPAIAPHIAALEAGTELSLAGLLAPMQTLLKQQADLTLIEGAGGWRVPINETASLSDLAVALDLPVILVVGVRLGAINHARLTLEAIERDGLRVAGWVANVVDDRTSRLTANLATLDHWLSQRAGIPCLGSVSHLADPTPERVGHCLDLDPLLEPHER